MRLVNWGFTAEAQRRTKDGEELESAEMAEGAEITLF
jgi:hypothetical protein